VERDWWKWRNPRIVKASTADERRPLAGQALREGFLEIHGVNTLKKKY